MHTCSSVYLVPVPSKDELKRLQQEGHPSYKNGRDDGCRGSGDLSWHPVGSSVWMPLTYLLQTKWQVCQDFKSHHCLEGPTLFWALVCHSVQEPSCLWCHCCQLSPGVSWQEWHWHTCGVSVLLIFWYRLTHIVLDKGPLSGWRCVVVTQSMRSEIERLLKRVKEITYEPQLLLPEVEQKLSSAATAGII